MAMKIAMIAIQPTEAILGRDDVKYVHARSALNNCYQCRIDRA